MSQVFNYNEHFAIVSIEGNIGSGKSTLLERLREDLEVLRLELENKEFEKDEDFED